MVSKRTRSRGQVTLEGALQGQHLVQDHAEGVNVRPLVDAQALGHGLLGGHVVGRAGEVARTRKDKGVLDLGQAEVRDLGLPLWNGIIRYGSEPEKPLVDARTGDRQAPP